jgi:hypothetical protein
LAITDKREGIVKATVRLCEFINFKPGDFLVT